jgi:hypothetical protein
MALIIEDGTQVANSNSFVNDAAYVAYAALKGLTVGATASEREIDLLAGIDYLLGQEGSLQGYRVSSTQAMFFPRTDVSLYGWVIQSDSIPENIKNAQMEAAAYNTSGALLSNTESTNTQSEKVDVLEVTYFKGGSRSNVNLQRVDIYLQPLLKSTDKLVRT